MGSIGKFSGTSGIRKSNGGTTSQSKAGESDFAEDDGDGEGETMDTALSSLKRKLNFSTMDNGESLAERIRARKESEEIERAAREKAFDEGLIGAGGIVAEGVENVVLLSLEEEDVNPQVRGLEEGRDMPVIEIGGLIDLNYAPMETGANGSMEKSRGETSVQITGSRRQDSDGQEVSSALSNQDSDLFNLEPIIAAVTKGIKSRKRVLEDSAINEPSTKCVQRRVKQRATKIWREAEETSLEGSPKSP